MKKTSYVILALIGAWILAGTIAIVLIAVNGRPADNDYPDTAQMTGPTVTLDLDPFDKVVFHSDVYLATADDPDDETTFLGVEIHHGPDCSVEYAEAWADGFTYEINDRTLSITLKKPTDMKSWSVAGDPIIIRMPDIKEIYTAEPVDIVLHGFDIPSLEASVTTLRINDCRIAAFEYTADAVSTIYLGDSTLIDTADIILDESVTLTSADTSRYGTINARSCNGLSELRIFGLDYTAINVGNTDTEKVELYSTQPYSVIPAKHPQDK